jgi:hypothetical protein
VLDRIPPAPLCPGGRQTGGRDGPRGVLRGGAESCSAVPSSVFTPECCRGFGCTCCFRFQFRNDRSVFLDTGFGPAYPWAEGLGPVRALQKESYQRVLSQPPSVPETVTRWCVPKQNLLIGLALQLGPENGNEMFFETSVSGHRCDNL